MHALISAKYDYIFGRRKLMNLIVRNDCWYWYREQRRCFCISRYIFRI